MAFFGRFIGGLSSVGAKDFFLRGLTSGAGNPTGTAAQTLPSLSQAATGDVSPVGTIAQTLPGLAQAATGNSPPFGLIAQTLPGLTMLAYGGTTEELTLAGFPAAPETSTSPAAHRHEIAQATNRAMQGKTNNTGFLTLSADVVATTVTDVRVSPQSWVGLAPITRNAAVDWAAGTTWVWQQSQGSFIVLHANNAQADRKYAYVIVG